MIRSVGWFVFLAIALAPVALAPVALAHGPHMQVDVVDNQIVTRGVAADTPQYTVVQPLARAYSVNLANTAGAWESSGPGFVILQNRFADGSLLRFNIIDEAKIWNGSGFVSTTPEELQVSRAAAIFANTSDVFPVAGFDLITVNNATAGQHRELRYTVLGDGTSAQAVSDDGVYLLKLELVSTTSTGAPTGLAPSLPFWMTLNKNVDPGTSAAAHTYVQTVLVPEPGAAAMLCGLGVLARLSNRRRRSW
jgi:hypothetical protein